MVPHELHCLGPTVTVIFEHSEGHNDPARVRNTNLSTLAFENMWSQPILIELLITEQDNQEDTSSDVEEAQ